MRSHRRTYIRAVDNSRRLRKRHNSYVHETDNHYSHGSAALDSCRSYGAYSHPEPFIVPCLRKEAFDEGYQEGMQLSIDDAKLKEAYQKGLADGRNQDAKDFADMYDSGYSEGLKDAWNAARKISSMDSPTRDEVFGLVITSNIFDENTASEAIEKIQQYEQEKEEIKAGDEIKSGNERYIVLQKYLNNIDELMVVLFNRRDGEISVFHLYNGNGAIFEKTGRHFPEIVEVLKKMRKE